MASQKEIQQVYVVFDQALRADLGEFFDFTCAFYNGNYSLTLEQAQKAKHDYILKHMNFKKGMRVLDIGSGWGPILKIVQESGGDAVGITLSPKQVEYCKKRGLKAYLKDWKDMRPKEYGSFDAIVSVGAFEHFCSVEEYLQGKQETIYRNFFKLCRDILPEGGRLYLQTSVWSKKVPPYEKISVNAPKESTEYLLALLGKFFPGSWIPFGTDQLVTTATRERLQVISVNTSATDYPKTIQEWASRGRRLTPKKIWAVLKLIPRYLTNRDFRYQIECVRRGVFTTMYKRGVMYLARMVFEK